MPTRTPDNSDDDTPKTMFEWQLAFDQQPGAWRELADVIITGGWKDWEADFDRAVNDAC